MNITMRDYTEEEQELINEAMRLVVLEKEIPKELAEKVKEIRAMKRGRNESPGKVAKR